MCAKMARVERDDEFYMTLVTIQVEDCLFRIPRRSLESASKVFRDMFSVPAFVDAEGSCDDNPIRLEGMTKKDFKRFLEVLFNGGFEEAAGPCPGTIFDRWFPVLKLAQMWEFDAIFKHAVNHLPYEQIDKPATEKVALAAQYGIQPWLLSGVNELARRKEPLGQEDVECLGLDLALKVAAVRESLIIKFPQADFYYPRPENVKLISGSRDASKVDFTPVIKSIFHTSDDVTESHPETGGKRKRDD